MIKVKTKLLLSILVISTLFFSACSDSTASTEIARFSPGAITAYKNGVFIAEDTLKLKADEPLEIWTEMDYSYEGKQNLLFRVVLFDGEEYLTEFYVDPEKAKRYETDFKEDRDSLIYRKTNAYNGPFKVEKDSEYNIKVMLMGLKNPSFDINRADLILKQ